MVIKKFPPVLFEMLQSFVSLANSLNLAQTISELNISRQTVRRHIANLETLRNEKLFFFQDRRYVLTIAGQNALAEAQYLIGRTQDWTDQFSCSANGLRCLCVEREGEVPFFAQEHPIYKLWSMAPPLLVKGLQAWNATQCHLEHKKLNKIRPYLVVYRKNGADWICSEVGEKSSYATWLGWKWAKSAVGLKINANPIISTTNRFITDAYEIVGTSGGVLYDHISTRFPHNQSGELVPVNYQRLVMAMVYPDGEPAVASLVARTNNIQIDKLPTHLFLKIPNSELMEFDPK